MDIKAVVGLASKAIEGVLVFRMNAFNPKSFIDTKEIRSATARAIRSLSKQRGYSTDVPLVNVAEVIGSAVSNAAEKWNKVADPKNHIDGEWLRHCVCDLINGAVIHSVFKENERLHAEVSEEEAEEEYLDPVEDGYENTSNDTFDTVHRAPVAAPSNDDQAYYGLERSRCGAGNITSENEIALLPRHHFNQAWEAIMHREDDPAAWTVPNDHQLASLSPEHDSYPHTASQKSATPQTDSDDEDENEDENEAQIVQLKRRRNEEQVPAVKRVIVAPVDDEEDDDNELVVNRVPKQPRKVSSKLPWTSAESELLVSERNSGKNWDEVKMAFDNRSKSAIMNKYRQLKDDRI